MSLPQDLIQAIEQPQVPHGDLPDPHDKLQEPKSSTIIQKPQYLEKEMYASLDKPEECKLISTGKEEDLQIKLPEYPQSKEISDSTFPIIEQITSKDTSERPKEQVGLKIKDDKKVEIELVEMWEYIVSLLKQRKEKLHDKQIRMKFTTPKSADEDQSSLVDEEL